MFFKKATKIDEILFEKGLSWNLLAINYSLWPEEELRRFLGSVDRLEIELVLEAIPPLAEDWDEDCWVKSLLALALRLTFLFVLICTVTVPAEVEEDLKLAPAMFGPLLLDAGLVSGLLLLFVIVVCPISSTVMNPGSETPPPRIRIFSYIYFYFKACFIVQCLWTIKCLTKYIYE